MATVAGTYDLLLGSEGVSLAPAHRIILELVEEGSRVLDLGCGEGALLQALAAYKGVRAEGIELSEACIQACVAKGLLNVYHGDLDEGLADYGDGSVDYVVLSDTMQVLHRPQLLIREMVRVGKRAIIGFPNFGHWPARLQLALGGHMPRTGRLPYEWYDTPNIHLTTIADFEDFCRRAGLRMLQRVGLRTGGGQCRVVRFLPNLLADTAVFVVEAE